MHEHKFSHAAFALVIWLPVRTLKAGFNCNGEPKKVRNAEIENENLDVGVFNQLG